MSLIKREYSHVSLPLPKDVDGRFVLNDYLIEFSDGGIFNFNNFVAMILNIINDFLHNKVSEKQLEDMMNATYFSNKTKIYFEKPNLWEHNTFLGFISELGDITWMKESPSYERYKEMVKDKFARLLKKYEALKIA